MKKEVTTHFLEMTAADQLIGKPCPDDRLQIVKVEQHSPVMNLFFFMAVGLPFKWYSRLTWSYSDWETYFRHSDVHTCIGYDRGAPFGYYELIKEDGDVEIKFFGLLPEFTGKGFGGWFLTRAVNDAWALHPGCVRTHTCSEDHPAAYGNYLARGFRESHCETRTEDLPEPDDPRTSAVNFWASYLARFDGRR